MGDPAFAAEMRRRRDDPHVAPVNALVDELNGRPGGARGPDGRGPVPLAPAHHGGVDARVLALLSNPGPAGGGPRGSGFTSCENEAPSSARLAAALEAAGLPQAAVLLWNAFPWSVHETRRGSLTAAMRQEGVEPLRRLLALAPRLRAVVLHGRDAQDAWARLLRTHPGAVAGRDLAVLPTWHPGAQVFAVPEPLRTEREQHLRAAYARARLLVG
jgi:hypothetical protein